MGSSTINEGVKIEWLYTDSDYVGYVFFMSSRVVSLSSKIQPTITLLTTEAEFVAVVYCDSQVIWMRRILEKLGHSQHENTTMFCDDSLTIKTPRIICYIDVANISMFVSISCVILQLIELQSQFTVELKSKLLM